MRTIYKTLIILFSLSLSAQEIRPLIYQDRTSGSDSEFNPITFYFNNAFDTLQNPDLFEQKDYFERQKLVLNRITRPRRGIKNSGGTEKFIQDEFLGKRSAPNYSVHLVGGGYDFRKLAEWYQSNGYSYPYTLSFLTTYASKLGNEAIESTDEQNIGPTDHIADLYFFDLIGNLMFTNDQVVTFFQEKFDLVSWGGQPLYNLDTYHISNAASQYVIRPKLTQSRVRPFVMFGMQILFGASYDYSEKSSISLATGMAMTDPIRSKGRLAGGLFYDKEKSLMSSLLINSTENFHYRLNIYPGILEYKNLSPGLMVALDRQEKLFLGASLILPVGVVGVF